MRRFLVFFIIAILGCESAEDDLNCKSLENKSPTLRLQKHLFCEYDPEVRPALKKSSPTVVDIHMAPQYIEFYEQQNQLNFYVWLDISWPDAHLTWEPEKWENIREIHVKSWRIWKPDLSVFNHGDMSETNAEMASTDCSVTFNGTVNCVAPSKYTSHCPTDYSEWPYDKHDCTIQIGAWIYERSEILLKFGNDSIMMEGFRPNHQWHVHIQSKAPEYRRRASHEDGDLSIFINVQLQRHASRLAIVYILPIVVLMIMTLIVLWLDSQSLERIIVACINFICHILGISDLHYYFPTNGSETIPKILSFYETSVGLAAFALIFTCLLRKLRDMSIPAPTWIVTCTTLVLSNPVRSLLRLNVAEHKRDTEETENNVQPVHGPKDRTWQELATILEWISFAVVLLTYIVMLAIVLPPREPVSHHITYWY